MRCSSRYPAIAAVTLAVLVPPAAPMPAAAKSASLIELSRSSCSTVAALSAEVVAMPANPSAVVPIPKGSTGELMLQELQTTWKELGAERANLLEVLAVAAAEQAECAKAAADAGCVGPEVGPLVQRVRRTNARLGRLAQGLERWNVLQQQVAQFIRRGRHLPKGHPRLDGVDATDRQLPRWHPPTGKRHDVGKASPRRLPRAHPPLPEGHGLGSRVNTDVIEI